MLHRYIIGFVFLCMVGACSRDDEEEGSTASPRERPGRVAGKVSGEAEGSASGVVRNSYVERHWKEEDEPKNEWTEEFKAAATSEERIEVLERKQVSGPEMLAPLIRLALRDADERVRTEAVRMLSSFGGVASRGRDADWPGAPSRDDPSMGRAIGRRGGGGDHGSSPSVLPDDGSGADSDLPGNTDREEIGQPESEVADLVVASTHDPASEVRILAMEAALELPPETQLEVYRSTIATPDETVRKMTITELGRMMSKPAFEVLTTGLQNSDSEFFDAVNGEIKLLVDRKFASYEEAQAWWSENSGSFRENMIEVDGSL